MIDRCHWDWPGRAVGWRRLRLVKAGPCSQRPPDLALDDMTRFRLRRIRGPRRNH